MINVNFNLLKVLNALLTEAHVTNAGKKIHLTQAATSNALAQLREIYNDPLLIRGQGSKMQLSPLAKALKPQVASALEQLEAVFSQNSQFIAKESNDTFHIGMSDYIEAVILNKLIKLFYQEAPKAKLVIHQVNYLENTKTLEAGELDLLIGNFSHLEDRLIKTKLFSDSTSFYVRTKHPILKSKAPTFKQLQEYPIITVNYADKPNTNYLAQLLQKNNKNVHVNITVPHAQSLMSAIINNDYVAYAATNLAAPYVTANQIKAIVPKALPHTLSHNQFDVFLCWSKHLQNSQANIWLRKLIQQLYAID